MIKRFCQQCKKVFRVYPSQIKNGGGKYCSKKCHYISKIGHIPWNKNTKGIMKPNKTSFKKGRKSERKGKKFPEFSGKNHWNWKKGIKYCGKYILIYSPNHPFRDNQKYVFEHRLIVEKKIGRYLKPKERVHHINENPSDNRIENLKLCKNITEHMKYHHKIKP